MDMENEPTENRIGKESGTIYSRAVHMKNQLWTVLLFLVLVLLVLTSSGLAYVYVRSTKKLQTLQAQANVITQYRTVIQSLANEAIEYSKRNPAIDPILQDIGLKVRMSQEPKVNP